MKKLLAVVLITLTLFSLTGCTKSSDRTKCGWCNGVGRAATGVGTQTKPCSRCGGTGRR